jgi:hypothetical protein
MAEKEVSFLTDRSIGGRFKRALAVALPSIALARKDPYLVKALYDKETEFGKLDRQDASDLIKTTASSITDLITKNKTKRQNRIEANLESLSKLKGAFPELDNADIALIQKRGMGKTLQNIKKTFNLSDVSSVLNIVKENIDSSSENLNASKIPNMTLNELAKAIAPTAKNIDLQMKQIRSQPSSGPITSFVTGEMFSDEKGVDLTPRVQNIVKSADVSQAVDTDATREFKEFAARNTDIFTKAGEEAKRISELQSKDVIGEKDILREAPKTILKYLGVEFSTNAAQEIIYQGDAKKYSQALPSLASQVKEKALALRKDLATKDDPEFITLQSAMERIINNAFTIEDNKYKPKGFVLEELNKLKLDEEKKKKKDEETGRRSLRDLQNAYKIALEQNDQELKDKIKEIQNKKLFKNEEARRITAARTKHKSEKRRIRGVYRQLAINNDHNPDDVAP